MPLEVNYEDIMRYFGQCTGRFHDDFPRICKHVLNYAVYGNLFQKNEFVVSSILGCQKDTPFFIRVALVGNWRDNTQLPGRNSPFLNPAIPSSFFLIHPFLTNFNSSFSCTWPGVANEKKVGWPWNSLLPAYTPLPFLSFSLLLSRRSSARTLLWLLSGLFQR